MLIKTIQKGLLDFSAILSRFATGNNHLDVIDQANKQKKKVDVLWINFLNSTNRLAYILDKNTIYRPAGDIIRSPYLKNVTVENATRNDIDELDLYETEFQRVVFDQIPNKPNDMKLHPIDSNLKKVKITPLSVLCKIKMYRK